jgi:YcxB-like protein
MPITAVGQYRFADMLRGALLAARRAILFFLLVTLVVIALETYRGRHSQEGWQGEIFVIGLCVFLVIYVFGRISYRAYRNLKTSPNLQGAVQYVFDDVGVRIEAQHSTSELRWPAMIKWKHGNKMFLLYSSSRIANMIPQRFFANSEDVSAVRELFRNKIAPKR